MHGAPSVSYPVGRSRLAGGLLLAAWALGALACARWAFEGASALRLGLAAASCAAAGGWALRAWLRQPSGQLGWDGAAWTWSLPDAGEAGPGRVQVALDLQGLLLLRWRGEGAARWFWLERARLPARWDALRRAVYSRADAEAPSGAQPPSART